MATVARYTATGYRQVLEAAVDSLEQAVQEVDPEDAALTALCRIGLAEALDRRYRMLGAGGDLDRATRLAEESVRLAPAGSSNLPRYRFRLASILGQRYDVHGSLDDLHRAIELLQAIVADAGGTAKVVDPGHLNDLVARQP
jgi:tetratricopeptide (TPR) repeat protein